MSININFNAFWAIFLLSIIILIFGFIRPEISPNSSQKSKYDGSYSLYLSNSDIPEIKWVTEKEDIGVFEIHSTKNELLAKGKTDLARAHSVILDQKINKPYSLIYGGETTGMHKILIREGRKKPVGNFNSVENIYVVGDIHGRYNQLINLLQKSHIIDEQLNWIAEAAHLVFLGDLFDRGNDVTKVLWFIYELEAKAKKAGGHVHLVLGNHEIMTMTKDLRYASQKELSIGIAHKMSYDQLFHPTQSLLGAWLRSKPSLLKIDQIIFAHGGILELGDITLKQFNQKAYQYMEDPIYLDLMLDYPDSLKYSSERWYQMRNFFYHSESPYWYRGYVKSDTLMPQLKKMLKTYNSKIHVVAHTPLETITERYKGHLLTTDLKEAATQLLLLSKHRKHYNRFKIDSDGIKTEL